MSLWRSRPLFTRPPVSLRTRYTHVLARPQESRESSFQAETVDNSYPTMNVPNNDHDDTNHSDMPLTSTSIPSSSLHLHRQPENPIQPVVISPVTSSIPIGTPKHFGKGLPAAAAFLHSRSSIIDELEAMQQISVPKPILVSQLLMKWINLLESNVVEQSYEASKTLDRSILFSFLRLLRSASYYHLRQKLWHHQLLFHHLQKSKDILNNQWSCDAPMDCLALEAAMGEVMNGVREWDTLLQSLRRVHLLQKGELDEVAARRFSSAIVNQWIDLQPWVALEIYRSSRRSGVTIGSEERVRLFELFLAEEQFTVALEILAELRSAEIPGLVGLVEQLMRSLADSGTVTLPDKLALLLGEVSIYTAIVGHNVVRDPWLWEWCVQVLVSSRQYIVAVDILEKVASTEGRSLKISIGDDTLLKVIKSLCNARLFTLAERIPNLLPPSHPTHNALLHLVFRSIARAGLPGATKRLWNRLKESSFTPSNHDRLLLLQGTRNEWLEKGIAARSILELVSSTDRRTVDLGQRLLNLAGHHKTAWRSARPLIKGDSVGELDTATQKTNTATFNSLLSSTLMRQPKPQGSKLSRAQRVFATFLEIMEQTSPSPAPSSPIHDLVTFNILIKALISLDSIGTETIRCLFDRLILAGYPSGEYPIIMHHNKGPVFGSNLVRNSDLLDFTRSSNPWFKEHLSKESLQRSLSFEKHVEPLYKMFKKAFYVRGDKESARVVLHVYKSVKEKRALEMEAKERMRLSKQRKKDGGD